MTPTTPDPARINKNKFVSQSRSGFEFKSQMAPTGFEPATPGLKVQCSTSLSYGAVIKIKRN